MKIQTLENVSPNCGKNIPNWKTQLRFEEHIKQNTGKRTAKLGRKIQTLENLAAKVAMNIQVVKHLAKVGKNSNTGKRSTKVGVKSNIGRFCVQGSIGARRLEHALPA